LAQVGKRGGGDGHATMPLLWTAHSLPKVQAAMRLRHRLSRESRGWRASAASAVCALIGAFIAVLASAGHKDVRGSDRAFSFPGQRRITAEDMQLTTTCLKARVVPTSVLPRGAVMRSSSNMSPRPRERPTLVCSEAHHRYPSVLVPTATSRLPWRKPVASRLAVVFWIRMRQRHRVTALHSGPTDVEPMCNPPVLYPQRWVQLAFLALLALISDLVCFSVSATPETWTQIFNEDAAILIDLFLFTNVFSCFLEPFLVKTFGLRIPIVGAALLMAVGCGLRSGIPFVGQKLPPLATIIAGTMMVAVAQPFFPMHPASSVRQVVCSK